jgi:hypothetical protein
MRFYIAVLVSTPNYLSGMITEPAVDSELLIVSRAGLRHVRTIRPPN